MIRLIISFFVLTISIKTYAVVSFEKCQEQGKIYFCHVPSNDPTKAHVECTANPSTSGHYFACNNMTPGHGGHCTDWLITNPSQIAYCGNGSGGESSSLEVCNIGIKHFEGRQGHIDSDLASILNSGTTKTTHDYVNFTFIAPNSNYQERGELEAFEDSFNSPWDIETSFQSKILNAAFNFGSENKGAEMFIDFCYKANGNNANAMVMSLVAPMDIETNAEISCEFGNSGFVPLDLSRGGNNWTITFNESPDRCLVRVYGKESTTEIRKWAMTNGLFNINNIRFIEPTL